MVASRSRLVFDQISGYRDLIKLVYKIIIGGVVEVVVNDLKI